ncbi:hypothetical protein GCM10029978_066450 [Actinoallomurus acanthiterrae]
MARQETVGARIKELRRRRSMTQYQLAKRLRDPVSDSYIALIELGRRNPTPGVLTQIAKALGTDDIYLKAGVSIEIAERLRRSITQASEALNQGWIERAFDHINTALSIPSIAQLPSIDDYAAIVHARVLEDMGRFDQAVERLRPLVTATRVGETVWTEAYAALARCHRRNGDPYRAEVIVQDALRALPKPRPGARNNAYVVIATELIATRTAQSNHTGAERVANDLISRIEDESPPRLQYVVYWHAAQAAARRGDGSSAVRFADTAVNIAASARFATDVQLANDYASLVLSVGDESAIERALNRLLDLEANESVPSSIKGTSIALLVRCHVALGNTQAVHENVAYIEQWISHAPDAARGQALVAYGKAFADIDELGKAIELIKDAAALLDKCGYRDDAALAWTALAAVYQRSSASIVRGHVVSALRRALNSAGIGPVNASAVPYEAPAYHFTAGVDIADLMNRHTSRGHE